MSTTTIFAPRENDADPRVALSPDATKKLVGLGYQVQIQPNLGLSAHWSDAAYTDAGADVVDDATEADIVLRVNPPSPEAIGTLKAGALHISFLDPFNRPELLQAFAASGTQAVSLEMLPRSTLAQKMDALSSQANLAGYAAVLLAANRMPVILPMMMTPAGTLSPARVLIIGVGVAGLQAIATARRLGARVEAYDTRPEVEEQVKSLGAKFVQINIGSTEGTAQGYAKELTPEQLEQQRQAMVDLCARADVVITTAKLFGRKAPVIVTEACVAAMRPGSVVVDLAAETGGNVEGSVAGQDITTDHGVQIIGQTCLEGRLAQHASQMFGANLANFIEHFHDAETEALQLDPEDEILAACLLTRDGAIVHPRFNQESAS